ncbi:MAG: FkbM family methyltransferase [Amylibacter sp.]|nr:FkbM family methyltransferase [Amylibacter sp.]
MNLKNAFRDLKDQLRNGTKTGPFDRKQIRQVFEFADTRRHIAGLDDPRLKHFLDFAFSLASKTQSQIFQDAFVLYVLNSKSGGFFCDFGATNGYDLSNSYALETSFGWKGICAEPARNWHEALKKNRPNARIETDCVWTETGLSLTFSESRHKELSTLTDFANSDSHARKRKNSLEYDVTTISLNGLLKKHKAPEKFDYLSMDTEGSELAILQSFDLKKWMPKILTIEHNYTPSRTAIYDMITAAGYTRVLTDISCFDDWYLAPGYELPEINSAHIQK